MCVCVCVGGGVRCSRICTAWTPHTPLGFRYDMKPILMNKTQNVFPPNGGPLYVHAIVMFPPNGGPLYVHPIVMFPPNGGPLYVHTIVMFPPNGGPLYVHAIYRVVRNDQTDVVMRHNGVQDNHLSSLIILGGRTITFDKGFELFPGNPCKGKIGGRLELLAEVSGWDRRQQVCVCVSARVNELPGMALGAWP